MSGVLGIDPCLLEEQPMLFSSVPFLQSQILDKFRLVVKRVDRLLLGWLYEESLCFHASILPGRSFHAISIEG